MNATSHLPPVSGDQNPVFAYPLHWAQNDAVRALADGFDAGRKRQYVDMPTGTGAAHPDHDQDQIPCRADPR